MFLSLQNIDYNYIYKDAKTNESVYDWGQGEAGLSVHIPEVTYISKVKDQVSYNVVF